MKRKSYEEMTPEAQDWTWKCFVCDRDSQHKKWCSIHEKAAARLIKTCRPAKMMDWCREVLNDQAQALHVVSVLE